MSSQIGRAVAGLVALGLGLALGEFSIRLALPDFDPTKQVYFIAGHGDRPDLGPPNTARRQVKNTGDFNVVVRFNHRGLRDDKDLATAGPGDYVMVGNSFIFGWGVEQSERVSERLEAMLGQRVFNASNGGGNFNTYEEMLRYAGKLGANVDRVIIGVTMENNLDDYDRGSAPAPATITGAPHRDSAVLGLKVFLTSHSALYFATTTLIHSQPLLEQLAVRLNLMLPPAEAINTHIFSAPVIESSVRRLVRIARQFPATTVMLLPSRALWVGSGRDDVARIHDTFATRLRAEGIDVVDLRPAFEADGDPLSYHFVNDGHWNRRGHQKAAEILAEHFKSR